MQARTLHKVGGDTEGRDRQHIVYFDRETAIGLRRALQLAKGRERRYLTGSDGTIKNPRRVQLQIAETSLTEALSIEPGERIEFFATEFLLRRLYRECQGLGQFRAAGEIAGVLFSQEGE